MKSKASGGDVKCYHNNYHHHGALRPSFHFGSYAAVRRESENAIFIQKLQSPAFLAAIVEFKIFLNDVGLMAPIGSGENRKPT